ncbi:hypothetical protein NS206_16220 [Microbacterium testaceum]|nr:hypothetical protein NS206_16220 [Microbacterium testaceum]
MVRIETVENRVVISGRLRSVAASQSLPVRVTLAPSTPSPVRAAHIEIVENLRSPPRHPFVPLHENRCRCALGGPARSSLTPGPSWLRSRL